MAKDPSTIPLSNIAYHDQVAMLTFLEESPAVRLTQRPGRGKGRHPERSVHRLHMQVSRDFTTACCKYRANIERNRQAFNQLNRAQRGPSGWTEAPPLAPYLYNPATWVAFGRADAFAIVLLDDVDPMISIMADIKSPIDQATLAFCPKMASLAIPRPRSDIPCPFCDLNELFDGPLPRPEQPPHRRPRQRQAARADQPAATEQVVYAPSSHSFQRKTPLLAITRFKLGGLAVLGQGLLLQQAIFRAMGRTINEVLVRFWEKLQAKDQQVQALEITTADLQDVRCVFLDGQGSEDIVTLVACNNYSVAISMVTSLRCLTFQDVFAMDPWLPQLLDNGEINLHRAILHISQQASRNRKGIEPGLRGLQDNHIFSASYSTLAVAYEAFQDPSAACRGYAEVYAHLDANPGHLGDIERVLPDVYQELVQARQKTPLSTSLGNFATFHRFMVGRHDYLLPMTIDPRQAELRALPIGLFFTYLRAILQRLSDKAQKPAAAIVYETGLLDLSSVLVIPFPELGLVPPVGPRHFPLMDVLLAIRDRVFDPDTWPAPEQAGRRGALFNPYRLQASLRELRTPWSLCRTLQYLFQGFAGCLADPHLFDSVLDLYDALSTLYAWLTDSLPDIQRRHAQESTEPTPFGQDLVDELNGLLDAIQNAIMHRVYMMLPNTEIRDVAVDLRGGLNKLVLAADVPLKCGLYLLKLLMTPKRQQRVSPKALDGLPGDQIGAVTRLTFHPRTMCHAIWILGPEPRCLAHVQMNVAHIFRPAQFVTLFHESTHLLYELDSEYAGPEVRPTEPPSAYRAMAARIEEVFAGLLTHLLVFGTDSDLYLQHYVADYSMQPISVGTGDEINDPDQETELRFVEVLTRGFLVTHSIRQAVQQYGDNPLQWPNTYPEFAGRVGTAISTEFARRVAQDFNSMIEKVGPLFWGFHDWWHRHDRDAVRTQCVEDFVLLYQDAFPALVNVWQSALGVYQKLFSGESQASAGRPSSDPEWLMRAVDVGLETTRPLIRGLFDRGAASKTNADQVETTRASRLNTVQLVCQLIRQYVKYCYGSLNPVHGLHLYRDSNNGMVDLMHEPANGAVGWNDFQLDSSHGELYCVDPRQRRARLQREIVILKTLWDISTFLRAERLFKIILDCWPELQADLKNEK